MAKKALDPMDKAERIRFIKQQYAKNIALNVERNQPIMDSSSDEEFKMDVTKDNVVKKQKTKENEEQENMFVRDDKFF